MKKALAEKFARFKMTDSFTDEAILIAYAYNQQQPRFYSKFESERYKSKKFPSSSFKMQLGVENSELLVDGSIIAQNPSLYSLILAKELKNKKYVKVVSIGAGYSDFTGVDFKTGNFALSVLQDPNYIIDLFSYIKARAHSYWTKKVVGSDMFLEFTFKSEDFVRKLKQTPERLQVLGDQGLDYDQCITAKVFGKQAILSDLLYFKYYFLDTLQTLQTHTREQNSSICQKL